MLCHVRDCHGERSVYGHHHRFRVRVRGEYDDDSSDSKVVHENAMCHVRDGHSERCVHGHHHRFRVRVRVRVRGEYDDDVSYNNDGLGTVLVVVLIVTVSMSMALVVFMMLNTDDCLTFDVRNAFISDNAAYNLIRQSFPNDFVALKYAK